MGEQHEDAEADARASSEEARPESMAMRARIDALRREHETALAEAQHRFANCFQLLASLIRLRLSRTSEPERRNELAWMQNAVLSLGLVQQHLATAGSGRAALATYLAEQAVLWRPLCAAQGVDLAVDIDDVEVPTDKTVPLALIANELVTNCLEHAFPGGRAGRIRIALHRSADGWGALQVTDDGVGMPQSGGGAPQSLGLRLIARLTAQVQGTFSIETRGGTRARVRFPLI